MVLDTPDRVLPVPQTLYRARLGFGRPGGDFELFWQALKSAIRPLLSGTGQTHWLRRLPSCCRRQPRTNRPLGIETFI